MKITKLEKKKQLYLLATDQEESFYITEDTIVRFMLSKGNDITANELMEIKQFAQQSYGKNLALYYLSFKQRSQKEVENYLTKYQIEERVQKTIIQDLIAGNWINDQQYVENFLSQHQLSGDKGPHVLYQKLLQKGISPSLIKEGLEQMDVAPLLERTAQKLLQKYQTKFPKKGLNNKLIQALVAKGFSYTQAQEAVEQLEIETDEEVEQELLQKELDKQYRKYSRKYTGYSLQQRLIQALLRKGYDYQQIQESLQDYL